MIQRNKMIEYKDDTAIEYFNRIEWYKNGYLHREDGPAIEYTNGSKEWFINGKFHREDGPARIYSNGYKEWWLNGTRYTEEDYYQEIQKRLNKEKYYKELTVAEISELLGYDVKIIKG